MSQLMFTASLIICLLLLSQPLSIPAEAKKHPPKEAEWQPLTPKNINYNYTPLTLPEAAQRGLGLSKTAKLSSLEPNHFQLSGGCVLVTTNADILIDGSKASVESKPGTAFIVHSDETTTRVLNLSDRHRDSIRVIVGKYYITLNPGEEVGLCPATVMDIENTLIGDAVRYRRAKIVPAGDDLKAVIYEVSLADALKHCLIFQQLTESPYDEDRLLLKEIVKTAAAVNTMFDKSREKYGRPKIKEESQVAQNPKRKIVLAKLPGS